MGMPTLPKPTKCESLQCKAPRVGFSSYCSAHGGKVKLTAYRVENNAPYKTKAWHDMRARQLSIQPLCQSCLLNGLVVQALHVDHVIAWRAIGELAFRRAKLQSLCAPCHSLKTSLESTGIFRHFSESGIVDYGKEDYARLIQSNSPTN